MLTRERVAELLSEILSDQYEAKITVILKEVNEDVPSVQT